MNIVESKLSNDDYHWLPPRYRFEREMPTLGACQRTVHAVDASTESLTQIELIPAEQFDGDGIFRLEHFFGHASRLNLELLVAPTDHGTISDDSGQEFVFLARPIVEGVTLQQLLVDDRSLWEQFVPADESQRLIWMQELLKAIEQMHSLGIMQQDFRPSQLLLCHDGLRLVCPGLQLYAKPEIRPEEWTLGFVKTASPELLGLIERDVNNRSDIYSIGVLFYCLHERELPFNGDTLSQILSAHLTKRVDEGDKSHRSPTNQIISRMLEKLPHDRYQTVSAIVSDLQWLQENENNLNANEFVAGRIEVRELIKLPMFVGRHREREQLREINAEIRQGSSRFIQVKGESGIGKTRLVEETLKEARQLGMRTFQTEAIEHIDRQTAAPLTKLINSLAHSDVAGSLAERLDDDCEEIYSFFPEFAKAVGLRKPKQDGHSKRSASAIEPENSGFFEVNRLSRAVCSILSKLATPREPAIIWIDDCQWLDANTIETLRALGRWETGSLLVILSTRVSSEQPDTSHIDISFDVEIETGPLSESQLTELVDSMVVALPKRAIETVVRLAAGSPLMAEAILREMVETGALVHADSQWTVDDESLLRVEASSDATEALLHRLEHFPQQVKAQLSIAAIIGKSFHSSTVSAISGGSTADTQLHLDWARQQRLIWSRPDGTQAFVHDQIRLAMIETLLPQEKTALHIQLAEYFEAQNADPIQIAIHFDKAGLPQRALKPSLEAAHRAHEASSFSTALKMFRIAWKGVPESDTKQRSKIAEQIGNVLMLSGKYEYSDKWFQQAEETAESTTNRARIMAQRGELAFKRGDKSGSVVLLEKSMKLLKLSIPRSFFSIVLYLLWELLVQVCHSIFPSIFLHRKKVATDRDRMNWRMYSRLAHCFWYTKSSPIVLWAHLAGLNRAETGPKTRELAQAWSEHAPVMSLIPWYERGANYSSRSLQIRSELTDVWGEGQSRNYFSILLYSTSRYEKCIRQARTAEEILLRTGDYWELNVARYQRAASLYRLGHLKEAYELACKTRLDAIKVGDYQSSGDILDVIARASLGKIPLEFIETEKNRKLDDLQLQPQLLLAEGVSRLYNDTDPSAAIGCFERALTITKQTKVSNCYTSPNAAWLATALRKKIVFERSAGTINALSFQRHFTAAKRAVRLGRRFKNDLPHAYREMGIAWADRNDQKRARKFLLLSLKLAQSQGAQYEAALTQQAFERMDVRFGWRDVNEQNQAGDRRVHEIEAAVRPNAQRETVSIASRFDALLDAGRKITSALGERDILKKTVESAVEMLRGQTTLIVVSGDDGWQAWNSKEHFDQAIVLDTVEEGKPVVRDRESTDKGEISGPRTASVLCCPIVAGKEIVACIYVSNRLIESMFGSDEIRIAEFLGNAAGSSLEKESSFRELDELNASLEQKVFDRTKSLRSRTNELEITAKQLRATQHNLENAVHAAEAANQIKSDFLAKMSHEIRTPITAVLGFTQLILRGIVIEPNEQKKKIKSIESSGKHLLQLVNDLLDISRIEADKIEIEQIECRPLNLLSEIVESLRAKASEGNNELKLELISPLPSTIHSDPKRLRQIITNILGNAIKFTSDGCVTLRVNFEEQNERGFLRFDVIDTGIGMTPEQLANVFDPFVQADSSITRRFGGTGLGLSISETLTRALGGDIDVISRPGEGSTFSITIDIGEVANVELLHDEDFSKFFERRGTSEWVTADLSGLRILLADDAETNRDLISLVLRDCGATVTLVENGQQAFEAAMGDQQYDVVLMDMQMPILDGYSATRKLRSENYLGPIFALTANSMKGDREKCMAAGCSEYLTKPIDLNGLVESMAKLAGTGLASVSGDDPTSTTVSESIVCKAETANEIQSGLTFDESKFPENKTIRKFSLDFIETLDRRREEFEVSLQDRNQEELASLVHWLKGTSGTVMLSQLSQAAKEMEDAVHASDWEAAETIYGLIDVYTSCAVEFRDQSAVT